MKTLVASCVLMASTVCLALTACTPWQTPSQSTLPFSVLGPLSPTEKAQIIQARTTGLHTLAAVLAMSVSGVTQLGSFEMLVNYDATGSMRFTAFKDLLISTQPMFDLLFAEKRYSLTLHDNTGTQTHQGSVGDFGRDHPTFRALLVLGEALFLPGFDGFGHAPVMQGAARCTTQLRSGAIAEWVLRPETLEITQARVMWQQTQHTGTLLLWYRNYQKFGAYYIPGHVTLRDRQANITTQAVLKQVDINVPLAADVFDFPAPPERQSRINPVGSGFREAGSVSLSNLEAA